jgi:hypothetical protein
MVNMLTENRVAIIEDISQPGEFANMVSFLLRRNCQSAALVSVMQNGRLAKVLAFGALETEYLHTNLPFSRMPIWPR